MARWRYCVAFLARNVARSRHVSIKLAVAVLAENAGKVVLREELLRGSGALAPTRAHYLRVHVAALRRKLEQHPSSPRWILTVTGVGYRMRDR
jgi:DNA-binding response OmpR family regulator